MRALIEADVRAAFVNVTPDELALISLPLDFVFVDWDFRDFFAWRDPVTPQRGYIIIERDAELIGAMVRASAPARARNGMCSICHTMQPGNQVVMYTARLAGDAGERGNSVGTYMCADLSCHDNVRLAHPLAPNEVRAPGQADLRMDGTTRRMRRFVEQLLEPASH